MTTFEHALLGINGLLATGLQKRYGWKLAAIAGIAAVSPDWDGLPMLVDMSRFEQGHRVWGHNVFACVVLGIVLGTLDYRFDIVGRLAKRFSRAGPLREIAPYANVRRSLETSQWYAWMAVAVVAALSQIPADAVVSGADGLSDWPLKPFWPLSHWEFVYPMVPWGNVGITIIFAVAMIAQVRTPRHAKMLARLSLALVLVYIILWGTFVY